MTAETFRILVVDDEIGIQSIIKRYFQKRGLSVVCAGSGKQMREVLDIHPVHLVILDINLPDQNGFNLLREIRSRYSMGVIMLTSQGDLDDRLAGLNSGADDYVAKPFELSELLARTKAVLRRFQPMAGQDLGNPNYHFCGWTLNTRTHQLLDQNNHLMDLSPAEYQLLLVFIAYPKIVLSRDYLLQQTRGRPCSPFDRTIDVRIGKLRKKLGNSAQSIDLFQTVRGAGYLLNCEVTTGNGGEP